MPTKKRETTANGQHRVLMLRSHSFVLRVACHRDRLSARWHTEFGQDRRDVVVDSLRRNKQALGYGRVAQALGQQCKNLCFAPRQAEWIAPSRCP